MTSAKTWKMRSISGTLRNFANRVACRKWVPPSGASSISVTVCPKVAAQASKSVMPSAASRSGRRYRFITCISVTLLAIGVAVAKVTTRRPFRSRSQPIFMSRSLARIDPSMPAPWMFEIVRRFLNRCASSTNR